MSNSELVIVLQKEKGATRRWRAIGLVGVVVLAIGALIWWRIGTGSVNRTVSYVTDAIIRGDIRVSVTATGNLEPTNEVTVGSELSGTIKEVYVDTNDQVTIGQPLATLDTSKLEQQTESSRATANAAEAKIAQAQATLVESEANFARLRKLKEASGGKLPSQADMDTAIAAAERAKADLASAHADVRQAKANVGINESDLRKAIIRSPIDGIVLTRKIDPGQTVAATMTAPELFVVAEKLENMKLEVAVAEADIARVASGQGATFTVDAWPNRSFDARVKKVEFGSAVTDNVVTYTTELEVSNEELSLRPGMTATADIAVAEAQNVYIVPNSALRFDPAAVQVQSGPPMGERSFVQSLVPGPPRRPAGRMPQLAEDAPKPSADHQNRIWILRDGKPVAFPVETGLTDGRVTEVSGEGLSEGLPVILHTNTPKS